MERDIRRIGIWGIVGAIIVAASACNYDKSTTIIAEESNIKKLTYNYTASDNGSSGSVSSVNASMSAETLWQCVTDYCSAMHPVGTSRYHEGTSYAPLEYSNYRSSLCVGDMLMEMVDGVGEVGVANDPDSLTWVNDYLNRISSNFLFNTYGSCSQYKDDPSAEAFDDTKVKLVFHPLETIEQKEEMRNLALGAYYVAVKNLLYVVDDPLDIGLMDDLVNNGTDFWFAIEDPENSTGEALTRQMMASLSTIVAEMKEIKFNAVQEQLDRGVAEGDEWTSEDFGRKPALKHLKGNIVCETDEIHEWGTDRCWRRCPLGQTWNTMSSSCIGTASFLTKLEAIEACESLGREYYLPSQTNFKDIVGLGETCEGSDECNAMFSASVKDGEYWTDTVTVPVRRSYTLDFQTGVYTSNLHTDTFAVLCSRSMNYVPDFEIVPGGNANLSTITNSLKRAIALIGEYKISFPCFAMYGTNTIYDACSPDSPENLETTLLSRVNERRTELNQAPFSTIDQLASDRLTTVEDLNDAVQYMYAHLLIFPRLVVEEPRTYYTSPSSLFSGWDQRFMAVPTDYWASRWESDYMDGMTGVPTLSDGWVSNVGLVPLLTDLRIDIVDAFDQSPAVDYGHADAESATKALVDRYLGERYISYDLYFEPARVNSYLVDFAYYNAPVNNEFSFANADMRIIPVADNAGAHQFDNFLCLHKNPDCSTQLPTVTPGSCITGVEVPFCNWRVDLTGFESATKYVVELKDSNSSTGSWVPIGMFQNDLPRYDQTATKHGFFYFEGDAADLLRKILLFSDEDLNHGECETAAGLESHCLDRNWVPAIENELNSDGDQYETSYRHYLNLARSSAATARDMREEIINDLITEAHDEAMEDAQLQSAIDSYLAEIREICGDAVVEDFETWAITADEESDGTESYYQTLFDLLAIEYSCAYYGEGIDSKGARRIGPVHCSTNRNCADPTTLGDLGVLDGIGAGTADTAKSIWGAETELAVPDSVSSVLSDGLGGHPLGAAGAGSATSYIETDTVAFPLATEFAQYCSNFQFDSEDDFLNPEGLWEPVDPTGLTLEQYEGYVIEKLWKIRCWAMSYRAFLVGLLDGQQVKWMPEIFDLAGQNDENSSFLYDASIDTLGLNYGEYYTSLQKTGSTVDNIRTSAVDYVTAIDETIALVDVLRDSVQANASQSELMIAEKMAIALAEQEKYEDLLLQEAEDCIRKVQIAMGELESGTTAESKYTIQNNITTLERLNTNFSNMQNTWGLLDTPEEFLSECIVATTGTDYAEYSDEVCNVISEFFPGTKWEMIEVKGVRENGCGT